MREVLLAWIFIAGLWGNSQARAATGTTAATGAECKPLKLQLTEMHKAQMHLLNSLVSKNDAMADTLKSFAKDLEKKAPRTESSDFLRLNQSAVAFRAHKIRELDLVQRFEKQSQSLLTQVARCLE
jgi:hypothetical protein